jgi:hypothetical protein
MSDWQSFGAGLAGKVMTRSQVPGNFEVDALITFFHF